MENPYKIALNYKSSFSASERLNLNSLGLSYFTGTADAFEIAVLEGSKMILQSSKLWTRSCIDSDCNSKRVNQSVPVGKVFDNVVFNHAEHIGRLGIELYPNWLQRYFVI